MKTILSLALPRPRLIAAVLMALTALGLLALGLFIDTQTLIDSSYSWSAFIRVTAALIAVMLVKRLPRRMQTKAMVMLILLIVLNELAVFASLHFRG
ncbi:hypothetical protein [Vibrio pectenicida]|uniref:Uncharacterized protein n=1 Tax=Vibrio pectenicida TaxID=62763 RepID=A0A3R9F5M4_9VIBR|nr:hypothetical protein [Vibrio pectenicida]RSD30459.1 hypothetical protein EJA03_13765 [Vibrio pectenicida]